MSRPNSVAARPRVVPIGFRITPGGAIHRTARRRKADTTALGHAELEPTGRVVRKEVDADLLEQRAADFGEPDLQVDLQRRGGLQPVHRMIFRAAPGCDTSTPGFSADLTSASAWAASSGEATVPLSTANLADGSHRDVRFRHRGAQHLVDRGQVLADPDICRVDDRAIGAGRDDRCFARSPCRTG